MYAYVSRKNVGRDLGDLEGHQKEENVLTTKGKCGWKVQEGRGVI